MSLLFTTTKAAAPVRLVARSALQQQKMTAALRSTHGARPMTVLSKQSAEEYKKLVRTYRTTTMREKKQGTSLYYYD